MMSLSLIWPQTPQRIALKPGAGSWGVLVLEP
jgi:hypothetical protein